MARWRLYIVAPIAATMLLVPGPASAGGTGHFKGGGHAKFRLIETILPDTLAPMLRVFRPKDGSIVSMPFVRVSGWVERGATLAIGDRIIPDNRFGIWHAKVALEKGLNTLTFSATDAAGNVSTIVKHVMFVPLVLIVKGPHDGATLKAAKAIYRGWAQPGTALAVNGAAIPLDSKGFWKVKVPLAEGLNTSTFTATDTAGNVTTIVKHVTFAKPAVLDVKFEKPSWKAWSGFGFGGWDGHHCDGMSSGKNWT